MFKSILTILSIAMISSTVALSQTTHHYELAELVSQYETSIDKAESEKASSFLHKDFRVVANQLFGAEDVSIMNKETYLGLLKSGKVGGKSRSHEITNIAVKDHVAVVTVHMKSEELTFDTYLTLVQSKTGTWKIIEDLPVIKKN